MKTLVNAKTRHIVKSLSKTSARFGVLISFVFLTAPTPSLASIYIGKVEAPRAKIKPVRSNQFGHELIDDYAYLRNSSDPDTQTYLKAQDSFFEAFKSSKSELNSDLRKELKAFQPVSADSYPVPVREWAYYFREPQGLEYPEFRRRPSLDSEIPYNTAIPDPADELLLDGNALARGSSYFTFANPTPNGVQDLLAYGIDKKGDRKYQVRVLDLKTKNHLPITIKDASASFAWSEDHKTLFYVALEDKTARPFEVRKVDVKSGKDSSVFVEKDSAFRVSIQLEITRRLLFIKSQASDTQQTFVIPSADPGAAPIAFHPRLSRLEATFRDGGDRYFIVSNKGGAKNFALFECPKDRTDFGAWKLLLAELPEQTLDPDEFLVLEKAVAIVYRKHGIPELRIYLRKGATAGPSEGTIDSKSFWRVAQDDPVYSLTLHGNLEYDATKVRYNFESPRHPSSIFEASFGDKSNVRRYTRPLGISYSPDDFRVERFEIQSRDKTAIPVTLIRAKNHQWTKQSPVLFLAYGAYGINLEPGFNLNRLALLKRGFAIAIVHVRGGGEKGRKWYEAGRLLTKKNSFFDYIDVIEKFHKLGYGQPATSFGMGSSAGGLVIGFTINEKPNLLRAVVADVPFVDLINTMLDSSLPLTTEEYSEWGNPTRREQFEYMLSYSPYEGVRRQAYPAVLATTALNDSSVGFWESAKWMARLRLNSSSGEPLLLRVERGGGHAGASGRFQNLDEVADIYTFLISMYEPDSKISGR